MSKKNKSLRRDLHLDKHTSHGGWPGGHRGSWNDPTPVNDQIYNWIESMGLDSNPRWARLSESEKKSVLIEAVDNASQDADQNAEDAAREVSRVTGEDINKTDMNALVTALVGASGAASRLNPVVGFIYGNAVNVGLAVKTLYDVSQCAMACFEIDEMLKSEFGVDKGIVYFPALKQPAPLTQEEVQQIRNFSPEKKKKLRRLAVSMQQYLLRAVVSGVNFLDIVAIFDITTVAAGTADAALAASAAALVAARADKMIIGMLKLRSKVLKMYPGIVALGNRDDIIGSFARLLLGLDYIMYNLGSIYVALGVLEPGMGDELETYVDLQDAGQKGVERDLSRYAKSSAEFSQEAEHNFKEVERMINPDQPEGPMNEAQIRRIIRACLRESLVY